MNQILKFRAWDVFYDKFLYSKEGNLNGFFHAVEQRPKKERLVTQFTGQVDKNKKEIYVGDIVRAIGDKENFPDDSRTTFVSFSDDLQFVLSSNAEGNIGMPITWGGYESLEVIGNIYQNKDLLV